MAKSFLSEKALFKYPNSDNWYYRFQCRGKKFQFSTGTTNRKDALEIANEAYLKEQAQKRETTVTTLAGMTLAAAAAKYVEDVVEVTWSNSNNRKHGNVALAKVVAFLGPDRRLDTIDLDAARALLRWRKAQPRYGIEDKAEVSAATINRTCLLPLKYLLAQAQHWGVPGLKRIPWNQVILKEPKKARHYLHRDESLAGALAPGYLRFAEFLIATGLRLSSALIRKSQVLPQGIRLTLKGGDEVVKRISPEARAMIVAAWDNPTEWVFAHEGRPITFSGFSSAWRDAREKGKIPAGLTIHGLRHTAAMTLLKSTNGNLPAVQKFLDHKKIQTTEIYAKIDDEDYLAAINAMPVRRFA